MSRIPVLGPLNALFIDFDGTLIEIAARPEAVIIPGFLSPLLIALEARLGGALAILTGRPLASVDHFLKGDRFLGAGIHGAQLRLNRSRPATRRKQLKIAAWLQERLEADPALWVENKIAAVALHYRAAPERAAEAEALMRQGLAATQENLVIVAGKCVFEARLRGADKGAALRRFMQQAPFSGRVPVFAGDDTTDEDAIVCAQALGGFGIKIGPGPSAAQFRLASPAAVHDWLQLGLDDAELARSA